MLIWVWVMDKVRWGTYMRRIRGKVNYCEIRVNGVRIMSL